MLRALCAYNSAFLNSCTEQVTLTVLHTVDLMTPDDTVQAILLAKRQVAI